MPINPSISQYKNLHLITGKLASDQVQSVAAKVNQSGRHHLTVQTLPTSVAALISSSWVKKHLVIPDQAEAIVLPGYYRGECTELQEHFSRPFFVGPKEILDLPDWLGGKTEKPQLDRWDIQIIAEINEAELLDDQTLLKVAGRLKSDGADFIDLGCTPGRQWKNLDQQVRRLKENGFGVSVDSLDPDEICSGIRAGADLILSVNSSNIDRVLPCAKEHGAELVVIPDTPDQFESLFPTVKKLEQAGVKFRIDPILEPICLGFTKSISRYTLARETWPDAEIMMGVGNISELSDVDSAGVNFVLLGICQELGIRSVLTTEVINWAKSSVKELDIARRILFYSHQAKRPPKRVSNQLVCLRDDKIRRENPASIQQVASQIKDDNFRITLTDDQIVCYEKNQLHSSTDPFEIFDRIDSHRTGDQTLTASHSFYLGFEMCKAMIALQLDKNYSQDEALDWGHLTVEEIDRHRIAK